MGKKGGGAGNGSNTKPPPPVKYQPAPLWQQSARGGAAAVTTQILNPSNQARALRVDHLLRVATWASANVPPSGRPSRRPPWRPLRDCRPSRARFASLHLPEVGENCSVRVTKSKMAKRPSKYLNSVTTTCHMCTHDNVRPGTLKTHLKTKLAQAAARRSLEDQACAGGVRKAV